MLPPETYTVWLLRIIEQDEYGYLRVVRRGEADEGDDIFLRSAYLHDGLCRGAGLSGYAVAGDIGVFSRALNAIADDLLENLAQLGARFLAYDLAHGCCVSL